MSNSRFEASASTDYVVPGHNTPEPQPGALFRDAYMSVVKQNWSSEPTGSYIDSVEKTFVKQLNDRDVINPRDVIKAKMGLDGLVDRNQNEFAQRDLVKLQNTLLDADFKGFSSALKDISAGKVDPADMVLQLNENLRRAGANVCVQIAQDGNILVGENSPNKFALKFTPEGEVVDKYITRSVPDGRLRLDGPFRGGEVQASVFEGISDAAVRNIQGLDAKAHRNFDHSDTNGLLR